MGFLARAFFRGLAAVLPIALTVYVLWWFLTGAEKLLKGLLPKNAEGEVLYYFPGLGIAAGIVVTVIVGLFLNYWLVRWLYGLGTSILERVPFVKTLYRMLKDTVGFFAHQDSEDFNQVVMARPIPDGPEMLGFVTRNSWEGMPEGFGGPGKVGVYLPLSYQIGGYLIIVDADEVRPIDMNMEDALRIALAAGMDTSATEQRVRKGPGRRVTDRAANGGAGDRRS